MAKQNMKTMTKKQVLEVSEQLRDADVTHLLLVRIRGGIALSSKATLDDLYDFLQTVVETDPVALDVLRSVVESRTKKVVMNPMTVN